MSGKRKNPLHNLDNFLKQEASSFVTPKTFKDSAPAQNEQAKSMAPAGHAAMASAVKQPEVNIEYIAGQIQRLAYRNNISVKQQLLNLVKYMLEENGMESSKDKMLINTILYIENGDNWKEKVQEYWKKFY